MFQKQYDLLRREYPHPSEILREVVSRPLRKDSKSRSYFTLGVRSLEDGAFYMKLVRSRKIKVTEIDHEDLIEVEHPDNPYVHAFVLSDKQLLVVSRDSKFSSRVLFSAEKLGQLIEEASFVREYGLTVNVSPVRDPVQIIEYIRKAKHISKLGVVVRRENVFDAPEMNRSFKRYTAEIGGEQTKAEVSGGMIQASTAEEMVRAAASTGDDAYADLILPREEKYSRKILSGTTVSFPWGNKIESTVSNIVKEIRDIYLSVRGGDDGDDE